RLATRSRAVGPKAWPPAYAARSAPIQHRSDRLRSAVPLAHTCVEWFRSTSCNSMIASTQPSCHNRLKSLISFSVSLSESLMPVSWENLDTPKGQATIRGGCVLDLSENVPLVHGHSDCAALISASTSRRRERP